MAGVIDTSLAGTSNNLVTAAVLIYALAMLAYALDFAFGRKARKVKPVLHAATALDDIPVAPVVVPDEVPAWIRGKQGQPVAPTIGERDAAISRIGIVAIVLTVIAWACHLGSVVTRGLAAHRVPWGNMYEFSSMVTFAASTGFLILLARPKTRPFVRPLGAFVMLPIILTLGLGATVLYSQAEPLQPALQDYWIKIHVVAAIISWGTFMIGAVVTAMYLIRSRYEKRVAAAGTTGAQVNLAGLGSKMPPAADLDRLAYRINAFAFPIWTFAIVAGAIWAERAWGRYWGWDPKETWSFITWVVYAAYLHARATAGWKGHRAAALAILGFSCLTIDYYVVNIFVVGLHSYAGL